MKSKKRIQKELIDFFESDYIYVCSNCNAEVWENSKRCLLCGDSFKPLMNEVKITAYNPKINEHITNTMIISFDKGGYAMPKNYNGVAKPTLSKIELLGGELDLDPTIWSKVLDHEYFHIILFELGLTENIECERIINLILND